MRCFLRVCALAVVLGAAPFADKPAAADPPKGDEPRVALVIGNAKYKEQPLRNPSNDAKGMAGTLKDLGFDVTLLTDASARQMERAILDFGDKLKRGGVGFFYYAGHGLQVRGQNYLVPVDATIDSEAAARFEAVAVEAVTEQMGDAGNRINIVVLDACRNNPFERRLRGGSRGLAAMDAARGTLIAYATAPGSVAADGEGDNGLYTSEFLKAIKQPNLKAEEVFKRVRTGVVERSRGAQVPWESSSLTGDFVFRSTPVVAQAAAPQAAPATALAAPPAQPQSSAMDPGELAFWDAIKQSTNAADYRAYLEAFPNGRFAPLARARASYYQPQLPPPAERQTAQNPPPAPPPMPAVAAPAAKSEPPPRVEPETEAAEGEFLTTKRVRLVDFPEAGGKPLRTLEPGRRVAAQARTADGAWLRVAEGKQRGWLPADALKDIRVVEAEEWEKVSESRDAAALQQFLKRFPNGSFVGEAKAALAASREEQRALAQALDAKPRETPQQMLDRALKTDFAEGDSGRLYDIARDLPNPMRLYLFGRLHEAGNGVPRDPAIAARYYRLASEQGYRPAGADLARLEAMPTKLAAKSAEPTRAMAAPPAPAASEGPSSAPAATASSASPGKPKRAPAEAPPPEASGSSEPPPPPAPAPQVASLPPDPPGGGTMLPSGTTLDHYDRAMGLLRDGQYAAAEAALREFLAQNPGSTMAPNAQYWLGEIYWQRDEYEKAAAAFADVYRKYPTGNKAPDALMKSAIALGSAGRKEDACSAFREFSARFPGASGYYGDRATRERQRFGC